MNTGFENRKERFPFAHPLKEKFRNIGVPLWDLRNHTGIPEPRLSRYLNGIDHMPYYLENRLYKILSEKQRSFDLQEEYRKIALEALRKFEEKKVEKIEQESKEEQS